MQIKDTKSYSLIEFAEVFCWCCYIYNKRKDSLLKTYTYASDFDNLFGGVNFLNLN